jgi:hypothetical protein
MEPLQAIPLPASGVLVGITTANAWQTVAGGATLLLAYVATNSTQRFSLVSLQSAARGEDVLMLASRASHFGDMPYGVVVEVYLKKALADGETVLVALTQAGATTYYPPQPIDDTK